MATEAYTSDEIKLQDGTEVVLVPLPINRLRKFMARWGEFMHTITANADGPEEDRWDEFALGEQQFDVYLDLCVISLEKLLKTEAQTDAQFREWVGDTLDEHTIYRVLDKCGGLKLNPNPPVGLMTPSPTTE